MIKGIIYFSSWLREVPQELLFEEPWLKCRLYVIAEANWYWYIRCCWYHVSRQNSLSQSRYLHKEQLPYNLYNDFSFLEDTLIGLCFIIRTVLKRGREGGGRGKLKSFSFSRDTFYAKELEHSHLYIQALQNPILFQHSEVSFYQSSHTRGCRRMLLHLRQGNVCQGIPSDPIFRFVDRSALGRCL